jgi:signal transduction histidine kinase
VVGNAVRSVWAEPRAPQPPTRVWRDWLLVAVLVPTAIGEGFLRADVAWRPVALVLAVALVFPLLWRRTHPLAVVAAVFGALIVLDIAALIGGEGTSVGLYTAVYVLLLPYSLFRWGSGREAALGLAIILVAYAVGVAGDYTGPVDAAVAFVFLMFPAVLGASVRLWATSRLRELDQVRLLEREQLARELHDTVAHHVSAMVIRAQAGRVVAASHPGAALEALQVIEEEGSRTLAEMRVMVGALRDREDADLAPQRGVADIERLAHGLAGQPRIEVHVSGELDDIGPSVGAAIYRIAQESITNAVRHARHATRIVVLVAGDDDHVRLTVRDDGDPSSAGWSPGGWSSAGFGVVGMTERAALLGGTLEAGPCPDRGWMVNAVLPRMAPAG